MVVFSDGSSEGSNLLDGLKKDGTTTRWIPPSYVSRCGVVGFQSSLVGRKVPVPQEVTHFKILLE